MGSSTIKVMVMRIVTRYASVDEFIAAFRQFCDEASVFIPSARAKGIGIETGFSIRLADGTPMLRGLCVVEQSWATGDNHYGCPGVRLGIRGLTGDSVPVFERLLHANAEEEGTPTQEMAPLFPEMNDCAVLEESQPPDAADNGIPELIDACESGATQRIDDERNDEITRRIEVTERLQAPKLTILCVAPLARPGPRARISMRVLPPPATDATDATQRPGHRPPRRWSRLMSAFLAWYHKLLLTA